MAVGELFSLCIERMNAFPDDVDGMVLAQIAARGIDMTLPRCIEFAIAVPNENAADDVADALRQQSYKAETVYDEGEPDETGSVPEIGEFAPSWTVYVNITMEPDYTRIIALQAEFDRIARPLGGKSDGWGTMSD